ncbi:hypothetical protein [Capsulimonas corticalis]|uniref:hypothetical protein n=1 Tax=Capsulimonas corticalis TaxID=2219043 RepID=UPI000F655EC5|nr:hypothetical protein [Capsulimonas corticalis]
MTKKWNVDRCVKEAREWISHSEDFQFRQPVAHLASIKDWRQEIGHAPFRLDQISHWYGQHAAIAYYENDWRRMSEFASLAAYCDAVSIAVNVNVRTARPNLSGGSQAKAGLKLARAIVIGRDEEARIIARKISQEHSNNRWYDAGATAIGPFCVRLYADYLGEADPFLGVTVRELPAYQTILEYWRDPNEQKIRSALYDAGQRHVAQSALSHSMMDVEWPEFQSFPAEILAILKLREAFGLPAFSNMPWPDGLAYAILPETFPPVPYPDFLTALIQSIRKKAPAFRDGLPTIDSVGQAQAPGDKSQNPFTRILRLVGITRDR